MSEAHSAIYFNEQRDFWWNEDFIELMARRLGLATVRDALDVGCGVGHWHRTWARHFAQPFRIVAIDREPRWVEECAEKSKTLSPEDGGVECVQGSADALPFADASFDFVTCQTLLIHVPNPAAVVREMSRVLRPGGRILLAEPNNLAVHTRFAAYGPNGDIDAILRFDRFQMLCLKGKAKLGLGYNALGATAASLLDREVFTDFRVVQNDKAWKLIPPYTDPDEQAALTTMRRFAREGIWSWPREEARRYYEASGATGFDAEYDFMLTQERQFLGEVDAGTYACVTGMAMNLAFARKRE